MPALPLVRRSLPLRPDHRHRLRLARAIMLSMETEARQAVELMFEAFYIGPWT